MKSEQRRTDVNVICICTGPTCRKLVKYSPDWEVSQALLFNDKLPVRKSDAAELLLLC